MVELIDKWEVVSKLITLQNNYTFFKNEWDAERLYREIAKLEIGIGKTPGLEVVRCKDCVWFSKTGYDEDNAHEDDLNLHMGHCSVFRTGTQACRFCSYGERKDNERKAD